MRRVSAFAGLAWELIGKIGFGERQSGEGIISREWCRLLAPNRLRRMHKVAIGFPTATKLQPADARRSIPGRRFRPERRTRWPERLLPPRSVLRQWHWRLPMRANPCGDPGYGRAFCPHAPNV